MDVVIVAFVAVAVVVVVVDGMFLLHCPHLRANENDRPPKGLQ